MKRISILLIMLSIISTNTRARNYNHIPLRNRVQWSPYKQGLVNGYVTYSPYASSYNNNGLAYDWIEASPYAYSYGNSGLLCNGSEVSPYAFNYHNSGLVDRYTQYSPYAFSYESSGLIYNINSLHSNSVNCNQQQITNSNNKNYTRTGSRQRISSRNAKLEAQKTKDPSEAIQDFLKKNNLNYNTGRRLRMNGNTVSMDFVIDDTNIVIKFWNSEIISDLVKQNDNNTKIYENYFESWKEYFAENYRDNKVFHIFSSDKEDLARQLASFDTKQNDQVLAIAKN